MSDGFIVARHSDGRNDRVHPAWLEHSGIGLPGDKEFWSPQLQSLRFRLAPCGECDQIRRFVGMAHRFDEGGEQGVG
jgi:hypothetical protein